MPGTFRMPALLLRSLESSTHEEKVRELKGRERLLLPALYLQESPIFQFLKKYGFGKQMCQPSERIFDSPFNTTYNNCDIENESKSERRYNL